MLVLVNVPVVKPLSVGENPTANVHKTHITQGKIAQNNSSQLICIGDSHHEIHHKRHPCKERKSEHFVP